ncbi:HTH_48 domain-containing protein [Trichonephila clavata]|uniref:HTH_48 domain-containing protein n=1 Tax=Trichonephila clavata TaxID=2740835 RepID=A0A8X6G8G8_TRICU|nr:HTH_48 domain-containing protein [Trichonephila clavata]
MCEFSTSSGLVAATLASTNKAWSAGTTTEWTARSFFFLAKFRKNGIEIHHKPRASRPVRYNKNHSLQKVESQTTSTVRQLRAKLPVSQQTIFRHLKATGMVKKLEIWVPYALTEEQRLRRLETCKYPYELEFREPFLHISLTLDEKWVLYDNSKHKAQRLHKTELVKQIPKPNLLPHKILISIWWNSKTMVDYEFLPKGQTNK